MNDMLNTIVPKSDQLNADDLIGRTLTIRITAVSILAGEQPVAISYEGDAGKPWKPCKSMRRVLVTAWGGDGNQYVGRYLTLYRDDTVKFAGAEVGGIRISHMSHIAAPMTIALTASKAVRKPFTVRPLDAPPLATAPQSSAKPAKTADLIKWTIGLYAECSSREQFDAAEKERAALWPKINDKGKIELKAASVAASERIAATQPREEPAATEEQSGADKPLDNGAGDQSGALFDNKPAGPPLH